MPAHPDPDVTFEIDTGAGPLRVRASLRADGTVFEHFFPAYDGAFVLADEKETRAGFEACLALNDGPDHARLSRSLGPFREWVMVVEHGDELAGGANFTCHPVRGRDGSVLTMNLNYVYVVQAHRGRGLLRHLLDAVAAVARMTFPTTDPEPPRPQLLFLELNDPLLMGADDYARDSARAGVDQVDRVAIWGRAGVRIVDFPYAQPALSGTQTSGSKLVLGLLGADGGRLDSCTLGRHLERFFTISVLKGTDARTDPSAARQLERCDAECAAHGSFALLAPLPHMAALRALAGSTPAGPRPGLRQFLSDAEAQG